MNIRKRLDVASVTSLFIVISCLVVAAQDKQVTGQLVSLNSRSSSITIEIEAKGANGPEKKYAYVRVAKDAKWHICLADKCVETKGVDGFRRVNEYAGFEAYGIPHSSYRVTLEKTGDEVTKVKVEIAPGKHKD